MSVLLGTTTLELEVEALTPYSVSTGLPTPLFVVGESGEGPLDTLQSRVRLSGLKTSADAFAMFVQAVTEVRSSFYRRVPVTAINNLLGTAYTPTPVNADQTLRAIATATEIEWVRLILLRRLKVFFADHSAQARDSWQQDGLTRQSVGEDELERMEANIQNNLELLSGEVQLGQETSVRVSLLEPEIKPLPVGSSTWTRAQKIAWKHTNG